MTTNINPASDNNNENNSWLVDFPCGLIPACCFLYSRWRSNQQKFNLRFNLRFKTLPCTDAVAVKVIGWADDRLYCAKAPPGSLVALNIITLLTLGGNVFLCSQSLARLSLSPLSFKNKAHRYVGSSSMGGVKWYYGTRVVFNCIKMQPWRSILENLLVSYHDLWGVDLPFLNLSCQVEGQL